ncbi:MAG: hypothetical protein NTY07_11380 [Bacteroidia bacterium]|nr:hypothetical protein [Bacteroidia bacterium]
MKTSKIIFISLLGTIAFLILATLTDIRIRGRRNSDIKNDFKVNRQLMPSFKVLCVNNSRNITFIQKDSSFIEVTYLKDSITPKLNFKIKEDTLMVSDFEKLIHRNVSVTIHATDSLKRILLKNSDIRIEHVGSGKLSLNLDHSSVWMDQDKGGNYFLPILDVVAKNHSDFHTGDFKVDSLGIVLFNSKADLRIISKKISGTLSDSSKIYARQPEEISLKKDKTSKINVDDY